MSLIDREKYMSDDREKTFFYLCIRIDRRDESRLRIQADHFFIFLDSIGDIGSLHFSLTWDISWMDDVLDRYIFSSKLLDDTYSMTLSIRSP